MSHARILAICLLGLLLSSGIAATPARSTLPRDVIDPYLMEVLSEPGDQEIEVIVQFDGAVTERDCDLLCALRLDVRRTFTAIPAVFAVGRKSSVLALATSERVRWIELNERLEHHMDLTTTVIKATTAWNSYIIGTDNESRIGITGEGITVAIVDSGIDAGHPDLDYGEKVVLNLKSDSNLGWIPMEDSDTSMGHGTHCAGTIAGNGEASGGARRGVAPGAKLIGLSTGDGPFILNALGGLEWVYENSKPGANEYNIRLVSNSWGSTEDYNREDAICAVIRKLTYENNVVVLFSAGNEGSDNHDGHEVTTNPYSLEPAAISVAAMSHDGKELAQFSSRGDAEDNFTWPDVGAPGVSIWSTQPRRTYISSMTNQDGDAYYMAISGTSMSCPHVAGAVALLWQACPSMRVSEVRDDAPLDDASHWEDPETVMHESELILKLTSDYIDTPGKGGIPEENVSGLLNRSSDYGQGYGIINMQEAVALALSLEELRVERPNATVFDAYRLYKNITVRGYASDAAKVLHTGWVGEWGQLKGDLYGNIKTDQRHMIYIPNETRKVTLTLEYEETVMDQGITTGSLQLALDFNSDGTPDEVADSNTVEVDVSGAGDKAGKVWAIDVLGQAVRVLAVPPARQYREARIEYTIDVQIELTDSEEGVNVSFLDHHARYSQLYFPEGVGDGSGDTMILVDFYDLRNLYPEEEVIEEKEARAPMWPYYLMLLVAAAAIALLAYKNNLHKRFSRRAEVEVIDARGDG